MKSFALAGVTAAVALMALPATVQAKDSATGNFRVRARVPVSCWVRPDRTVTAEEGATGAVIEACNNPGGYTVSAQYRQLGTGESARMIYNDQAIELSSSGQQVLRQSNMATIRTVSYQFQNVNVEQPLILALTIQPI